MRLILTTIIAVALCGCAAPGTRLKPEGGRYVKTWVPDPPIPGQAVREKAVTATLTDAPDPGVINVDASKSRDLPGGWKGPVYETFGMKNMSTVFYMVGDVPKPGDLGWSTNGNAWNVVRVPDNGMNLQLFIFGSKSSTNVMPVGVGTPLMIKSVNLTNLFFYYRPDATNEVRLRWDRSVTPGIEAYNVHVGTEVPGDTRVYRTGDVDAYHFTPPVLDPLVIGVTAEKDGIESDMSNLVWTHPRTDDP